MNLVYNQKFHKYKYCSASNYSLFLVLQTFNLSKKDVYYFGNKYKNLSIWFKNYCFLYLDLFNFDSNKNIQLFSFYQKIRVPVLSIFYNMRIVPLGYLLFFKKFILLQHFEVWWEFCNQVFIPLFSLISTFFTLYSNLIFTIINSINFFFFNGKHMH